MFIVCSQQVTKSNTRKLRLRVVGGDPTTPPPPPISVTDKNSAGTRRPQYVDRPVGSSPVAWPFMRAYLITFRCRLSDGSPAQFFPTASRPRPERQNADVPNVHNPISVVGRKHGSNAFSFVAWNISFGIHVDAEIVDNAAGKMTVRDACYCWRRVAKVFWKTREKKTRSETIQ